ncbi:MAG: HD domain-containing protein [Gemmatimonadota bacterium]
MNGYSDDINHAFAFATKYRAPYAPVEGAMTYLAHPANVAVILARHGADEVTLVAGILHHVLEVTPRASHRDVCGKIEDKFGVSVLTLARAALEPREDERGNPLPWLHRKRAMLTQLLAMPTRAIDICCADEIHQCGTSLAIVERLGAEYLALNGLPATPGELCCYDDFMAAVERRTDWHNRSMRNELHALRTRLETALTSGA